MVLALLMAVTEGDSKNYLATLTSYLGSNDSYKFFGYMGIACALVFASKYFKIQ